MQAWKTMSGTTQPQVVGYLKFKKKKKKPKYLASQDGGVFKKFKKNNKETTPQLGVVRYNKDKFFVTFKGTPQLGVVLYQKHLKK